MTKIPFEEEFEKFWITESGWYDGKFRGLSEEVLARQAWAKAFSIMVAKFTSDNNDCAVQHPTDATPKSGKPDFAQSQTLCAIVAEE